MIFLIRPPALPTRSRNQADKVLSGCQRSHSQASSTIAARTRLLPSLPIPCSRSLPPRESLAHEKCREFGTDGPHVHERADHAFRLVGGRRLFQNSIARRFNLLDLPQG